MSASIGHSTASFGHDPLSQGPNRTESLLGQQQPADSVESYFECITTCSLDDGECITQCVELLREHH